MNVFVLLSMGRCAHHLHAVIIQYLLLQLLHNERVLEWWQRVKTHLSGVKRGVRCFHITWRKIQLLAVGQWGYGECGTNTSATQMLWFWAGSRDHPFGVYSLTARGFMLALVIVYFSVALADNMLMQQVWNLVAIMCTTEQYSRPSFSRNAL